MADIKQRVKMGLSETRTTVLGAQILLGFQYQALFQPKFERLSPLFHSLEATAFALLLIVVMLLLAPASFHRIAQGGEATQAQRRFSEAAVSVGLFLFTGAIGLNVFMAPSGFLGRGLGAAAAASSVALSLFLWFGLALILRKPGPEAPMKDQTVPLSEKLSELMTETRIILPGVQALLGFQFAAYLTDAFAKLPPLSQGVHTASLLLLLTAMILLMSPAAFHRLAERGENTPRADRVGVGFMLAALAALALGLAGDFYVVLEVVTGDAAVSAAGAVLAAALSLSIWFALPMLARRAPGPQDAPAAGRGR